MPRSPLPAALSLALAAVGAAEPSPRGPAALASLRGADGRQGEGCPAAWGNCLQSMCCGTGYTCYEKDSTYAQCRPTGQCVPGVHDDDPVPTHWSCRTLPPGPPGPPDPPAHGDPGCSPSWYICTWSRCCASGFTCYEKDYTFAQCLPTGECKPGVHTGDLIPTPWSCHVAPSQPGIPTGSPSKGPAPSPAKPPAGDPTKSPLDTSIDALADSNVTTGAPVGASTEPPTSAPTEVPTICSVPWGDCHQSRCCTSNFTCYEKDSTYAQCQTTGHCMPGVHEDDPVPTHWSCQTLTPGTQGTPGGGPADGPPAGPPSCSISWESCLESRCCGAGYTCYEKDATYAQCQPTGQCAPGVHPDDPIPTAWTCRALVPVP